MKCPKCRYVSFEYLDECKKCGRDLSAYKSGFNVFVQKPMPVDIFASPESDSEEVLDGVAFDADIEVADSESPEAAHENEMPDVGEIDLGIGGDAKPEAFLDKTTESEEIDLSSEDDDVAELEDIPAAESEELDFSEVDFSDDLSDDLNDDISAELEGDTDVTTQEEDELNSGLSFTEDSKQPEDTLLPSTSEEISESLDFELSDDIENIAEGGVALAGEDEGGNLEPDHGDEKLIPGLDENDSYSNDDLIIAKDAKSDVKADDQPLEELDLELGFGDEDVNLDLSEGLPDDVAIEEEPEVKGDDDFKIFDGTDTEPDDSILPDFSANLDDSFLDNSDAGEKDSKDIEGIDLEIDESFFTEDGDE